MSRTSYSHGDTSTSRNADLAKIHIAKKSLHLDQNTYQQIIRDIGGAESGSSADLCAAGRRRVLDHFREKGWRPTAGKKRRVAGRNNEVMASDGQVKLIRRIWVRMADDGVVKSRDEAGLRSWVRSVTRRYHPHYAGYSAPEFLPGWVAERVIEHAKQWAKRCGVKW